MDNIDLLALQFVHHRLHAAAAHPDAGKHGVDREIIADDGDFCTTARVARHRFNLDDAVVNLGHFLHEQLGHKFRTNAAEEHLRASFLAAHIKNIGADAIAGAEILAWDQFVLADDRFGATEIDRHIAIFHTLDGAVDNFADAIFELIILAVTLGIAYLLHNHLFRGLRGDTPEIDWWQFIADEITHRIRRFREFLFRLAGRYLLHSIEGRNTFSIDRFFCRVLDHFSQTEQRNRAGFFINLGLDVMLHAIFFAPRNFNRVRHRIEHGVAVDIFLARHRIGDLQHFGGTVNYLINSHGRLLWYLGIGI